MKLKPLAYWLMLPVWLPCLYLAAYLKQFDDFEMWWSFPYFITIMVIAAIGAGISLYGLDNLIELHKAKKKQESG